MLTRPGATLVELLVAITLATAVLGTASASVLRQQRTHSRIRTESGADAQLRASVMVIASQLSLLEPAVGDIDATQARDSALQFRAPIAISLACATETGAATLLPLPAGRAQVTGAVATPHAGDSLWWRADTGWASAPISSVSTLAANCIAPITASGSSLRMTIGSSDTILAGVPLRVTRQSRYGIYRAGDGSWQLGFREWNPATFGFAAPQPVAGPLLFRAGSRRSGFRYFDDAGMELVPSSMPLDVARLARVRLTVHSLAVDVDNSRDSVRTDSIDVAVRRATSP